MEVDGNRHRPHMPDDTQQRQYVASSTATSGSATTKGIVATARLARNRGPAVYALVIRKSGWSALFIFRWAGFSSPPSERTCAFQRIRLSMVHAAGVLGGVDAGPGRRGVCPGIGSVGSLRCWAGTSVFCRRVFPNREGSGGLECPSSVLCVVSGAIRRHATMRSDQM